MQVADVCEFYSDHGGGVKTYIDQKLEAGARLGACVNIIAPGAEDRIEKRLGGTVIWVKSPPLALDPRYHIFADPAPVHQVLDDMQPDIVEASSMWRGAWAAAKWNGSAPKVMFAHQDPVAVYPQTILSPTVSPHIVDKMCFWFWAYLRRLTRHYDATIVGGEWLATRFQRFGVRRPIAVPMGVDKGLFSHQLRTSTARMEMLLACGVPDPNATLFVSISRHHPEKRIGAMFRGFEAFSKNNPAGLYLIGDGPDRKTVERMAANVPGVYIAGVERDRERLARLLASGDYFLHGGAAETFGLVVAEALASGLPLIAPDRGGAAELAHPAYSETYHAGDGRALASALERIVARERETLSLAARAGAKRVKAPLEHFQMLFDNYAKLTEEKRSSRAAA